MKLLLASFFALRVLTADGDVWYEEGGWSFLAECQSNYDARIRATGGISECYWREGNVAQGNLGLYQ